MGLYVICLVVLPSLEEIKNPDFVRFKSFKDEGSSAGSNWGSHWQSVARMGQCYHSRCVMAKKFNPGDNRIMSHVSTFKVAELCCNNPPEDVGDNNSMFETEILDVG